MHRYIHIETTEREEIVHFAHEHPLIFKESEEINPFCCNACGLRMLSSPSYICTVQGCGFYLHEPCTKLPNRLSHRGNRYHTHDLHLRAKPPHKNCRCSKCGNLCKNFTYHCHQCDKFDLDPLCGHPLDIQINHVSHKEHPMAVICKESLLLCDVCGRKHNGFFFHCHQCNFLIHQDCASLPSIIRGGSHHRHPLSLTYSDALAATYHSSSKCIICRNYTSLLFGAYTCTRCGIMFHVDCAVSAMENPGKIYNLPPLDDAFLSWITCAVQNTTPKSNGETMLENYHSAHSLISNNESAHESLVCNACIRHIAPPYYSCSQSACDFLLHKFCADLPLVVDDLFGTSRNLVFPRCNEFFSLFLCMVCLQLGNGFGYSDRRSSIFHLECALAPQVIQHDSHKQHPLLAGGGYQWFHDIRSCCDKILNRLYYDIYFCTQCRFSIHIRCALLPKTVTHKFDRHPLTLITHSSASLNLGEDHFCKICEKDINPSYWFYRCTECHHSFHVDCIPSTGTYSSIKFGGTVVLPNCHGDHPLTLVRMLSVGSQTCGFCHKIIEGFKDSMALHCVECDFWIHFQCGSDSSGQTVSKPYRDISWLDTLISNYDEYYMFFTDY